LFAQFTHRPPSIKAQGLVLKTAPEHRSIVVSCDAIEGYMPAMDMPLHIEHASVFTWLKTGTMVRFTIIDVGRRAVARNIQALVNFEPEPAEAGRFWHSAARCMSPMRPLSKLVNWCRNSLSPIKWVSKSDYPSFVANS
jgi:Cu/Ag efflux protein CusF